LYNKATSIEKTTSPQLVLRNTCHDILHNIHTKSACLIEKYMFLSQEIILDIEKKEYRKRQIILPK
jgi:hypothetical protein